MSLLEEIKTLRELEQQSIGGKWSWKAWHDGPLLYSTEYKSGYEDFNPQPGVEMDLLVTLRNLAPAMLEVLGCFQKGDEDLLVEYIYQFTEEYGVDGVVFSDTAFGKFMKRMQKAASLMEQEEREA